GQPESEFSMAEKYRQALTMAREKKITMAAAEKPVFGADHADVGGYLLGLWGLPVPVVAAIALHHRPDVTLLKSFSPLTALYAGNVLVSAEHPSMTGVPASEPDMN